MADQTMGVGVRLTGEAGQLVGQLNMVAAAEGKVADGADKVSAAAVRAATATARLEAAEANAGRAMSAAERAQNMAALSALRLAAAQEQAANKVAKANGQVTQSAGALRSASTNLGFQIQDITQSLALGINPLVVFGQQAGQTASAVSGMGGALGKVGTFLSGGWGSIILAAVTVGGMFVSTLMQSEDALEAVEVAADNAGQAQALLGKMFDLATGKIKDNTAALRDNIYMNMIAMQQKAIIARQEAAEKLGDTGLGRTTALGRAGQRLLAYASQNPARAASIEQSLARQEGQGRQYESLGRGVATGGLTREEAGKILESRRGSLNDEQYFGLQDYLNRAAEEFSANKAAKDMQTALSGQLPAGFLDPKTSKPKKGPKDNTAAELKQLAQFGENAAEKIQRINEAFDEQPKLVDKVNQSTRELDGIIKELNERKPKGFTEMIAAAEKAKGVVQAALVKPFNDMIEASGRQRDQQSLILAGREDEAEALQRIYQLQDKVGFVTREQREAILANVRAEEEVNKKLAARQQLVNAYLGTLGDMRSQLEGLLGGNLSGKDFLKGMRDSVKQLQGKLLVEQFFGPALREMEEEVRKSTGIQSSVDIMKEGVTDAGKAATTLGDSLEALNGRVNAVFTGSTTSASGVGATASAGTSGGIAGLAGVMAAIGIGAGAGGFTSSMSAAQQTADGVDEIVVEAKKLTRGPMGMSIDQFLRRQADVATGPLMAALDRSLGSTFFSEKLQPVLAGAWAGYNQGGIPGGVIGAAQGVKGLGDKLDKLTGSTDILGKAFKGSQTGTMVAGIGKAIGLKTSTTGGQIGGAIGAALPIPGGEIIGSIIGSLVGGMFKKTPYGTATLTGGGEDGMAVGGNKSSARKLAGSLGEAVQSGLASIAEQLGAEVGSFAVSIGTYKDKVRVSPSGKSGKLKGGDVVDFGKGGEEEAIAYAIANAIKDGAIAGISAAVQKAIQSNADPDKALAEALKTKALENALGGFMGAAKNAFKEFEAQAKDRLRIATAYGLDLNKVEELNGKERVRLRSELERQAFGSLQDLLTRMRSGDLFEGSAVDQRQKVLDEIAATRDAAARGEEGAADKLAGLLEQLNSISRDVYGTTGGFAQDRTGIEATAQGVIDLLKAQLDSASAGGGTANPQLDTANGLLDENNAQNALILAELRRLGITLGGGSSTGTGGAPAGVAPVQPFDLASLAYTGGGAGGLSGGRGNNREV